MQMSLEFVAIKSANAVEVIPGGNLPSGIFLDEADISRFRVSGPAFKMLKGTYDLAAFQAWINELEVNGNVIDMIE